MVDTWIPFLFLFFDANFCTCCSSLAESCKAATSADQTQTLAASPVSLHNKLLKVLHTFLPHIGFRTIPTEAQRVLNRELVQHVQGTLKGPTQQGAGFFVPDSKDDYRCRHACHVVE
ncbi:hypothetical protein ABBQ32_013437 [Trebouxia sp. C0010 RCD-2024]